MIKYKIGNILESDSEALVNTVNTVGVMGKGIALAFKEAFPDVYLAYYQAVKAGIIETGKVQLVRTNALQPKFIINFPTKQHWRNPSKLSYIDSGLIDMVNVINANKIRSVAIPPLGCGNGKLDWNDVRPLIEKRIRKISESVDITLYVPGYAPIPKGEFKEVALTASRAVLIKLMQGYEVLGYSLNLLVAQKLCYFLQRFGEPMGLNFEKGSYGPYAHNLTHLLKFLNNSFIWFKESDNKPDTKIFLLNKLNSQLEVFVDQSLNTEQKNRMQAVLQFIEGFESPFGLELLATVDYVMQNTNARNYEEVESHIGLWTERKRQIMTSYHIQVATRQVLNNLYSR